MNPQAAFIENLETIERIIATICRRHLLVGDDQDDFASYVKLRLVDDDYAAFKKFQGRSSISTYLVVVITNCFRDFRVSRWGRWRPSAVAKRLGSLALRLEILMWRDGYGVRQAIEVLRSQGGDLPSDSELIRLSAQIPARGRSGPANPDEIENTPGSDHADEGIIQEEIDLGRAAALQALERALQTLPAEDRLILKMKFFDNASAPDIARALRLDSKPL